MAPGPRDPFLYSPRAGPDRPELRVTGRLAYLVGARIAHSLSPAMHNAAFAAAGLDARYELLDVTADEVGAALARLRRPDCLGANVTMPHKRMAAAAADRASAAVERCGAANLLVNRDGRLEAGNTDVLAIGALLRRRLGHLRGGGVAVAGAGGGAAAVLEALMGLPVARVVLLTRRLAPARALADRYQPHLGIPCTARLIATVGEELLAPFCLLVNATPVGMAPADPSPVPAAALHSGLLVYDLVYRREGPTALQRAAAARSLGVVDGLTHLLWQAEPTFEALTGRPCPPEVMRAALVDAVQRQPLDWGADPEALSASGG